MIRPITLITALMFFASGAYMFSVKHNAQVLDQKIAAANAASQLDAQGILVLTAQWSKDNSFDRLQQFASQYTNLSPVQPGQMVSLQGVNALLPPVGAKAPAQNPVLAAAQDSAPLTGQPPQTDPAVLLADAAPPVDGQVAPHFAPAPPKLALVTMHRADVAPQPSPVVAKVSASAANAPAVRVAQAITAVAHHKRVHVTKHQPESELAMAQNHPQMFAAPAGANIIAARAVVPVAVQNSAPLGGGSMLGMAQGTGGVN
jgi:hypothetical protein